MSDESRASRRSRLVGAEALHEAVRHPRDLVALIDQGGHRWRWRSVEALAQFQQQCNCPVEFLKSLGISDFMYQAQPAVKIPYYGVNGGECAVRFRLTHDGRTAFETAGSGKLIDVLIAAYGLQVAQGMIAHRHDPQLVLRKIDALLAALVPILANAAIGVVAGAIVVAIVNAARRAWSASRSERTSVTPD